MSTQLQGMTVYYLFSPLNLELFFQNRIEDTHRKLSTANLLVTKV